MRSAVLSVLVLSFAATAVAPRVLVRTVTTSAIGEAHGVYVHTVDVDAGAAIGAPLWLPADAPSGRLHLSNNGDLAATAVTETRVAADPANAVAAFGALPVPPFAAGWFGGTGNGVEHVAGFIALDSEEWLVSFGPTTLPNTSIERGTIALRPLDADGAATGPARRQLLPGVPAAGVTFRERTSVAVLAWEDESAQWTIHVFDTANGGQLKRVVVPAEPAQFDDEAALGLTEDEQFLIALIPDQTAGASGAVSSLVVVDARAMEVRGEAMQLHGIPNGMSRSIVPAMDRAAWIVTRDPISAFGYAAFVEVGDAGAEIKDDPSYTSLDSVPIAAPSPDTPRVAIAAGNRVEIRRAGEGVDGRHEFAAPVGALAWHGDSLLVGEGGRFHRFDVDSMSIVSTIPFQDGRIDAIVPVPPTAWDEDDADGDGLDKREELQRNGRVFDRDSDGDGLFDGVDPDVRVPSPILIADREVRLRAAAAGYESRLLRLDAIPNAGGTWSIAFDPTSAPWLRVTGEAGSLPGGPRLSLDPGALPAAPGLEAALEITAVGPDGERMAGSPVVVRVRVTLAPTPRRSIAWVLGDPANLERATPLSRILSNAPFHLSQHFDLATLSLESDDVSMLVMDESAATQSLVTRRAVSNFVRAGGGVVFLRADRGIEGGRGTESWLSPFSVMLTNEPADPGSMTTLTSHPLARWWQSTWQSGSGAAFSVAAGDESRLAGSDEQAIAYAGPYGMGRIAVLASPTPLLGSGRDSRGFAAALFAWLSRAPLEDAPGQRDLDGDGISDWMEDRDRNGFRDPGETDWMNPDTDGDGIPDGAEDFNLNGVLDAGETSPLIYDTDGDGIWDGADVTPIPPFAAPLIAAVIPDTAPAHGGRTVTIQGRNLRSSQRVWFGDRLATDVRAVDSTALSVVVPPASLQSQTPNVDVRVEDTETGLERTAAGLFAYSPPAFVQLSLRPVAEVTGPNLGVVALGVSSPEKVTLGRVALTLETDPPNAVTWGQLEPGVAAAAQGRTVTGSAGTDGALSIAVGASRHAQGMGELVTIPWARAGDFDRPVTIKVRSAQVTADNGYPLRVDASAAVDLP